MIDRAVFVAARKASGLSQAELASLAKCSQQLIAAIEVGTTVSTKFLPRIAGVLNIEPGKIDPEFTTLFAHSTGTIPGARILGDRDFPIYASAEGGPGQIILSSDPIDFVPRPAPLQHVKGAYGLYITGDSMSPEFNPGDMAIVNPHLPIIASKAYIFYSGTKGEARATIKRLRRASPDAWHVHQHNPPDGMKSDFTLSRKEWPICHRVLGNFYAQ